MHKYARTRINAQHVHVLELLSALGDATDSQLVRRWASYAARRTDPWPAVSDSTVRSSRADLVRWGLVVLWGRDGVTRFNRPTRSWTLAKTAPGKLPVPVAADAREALVAARSVAYASGDLARYAAMHDLVERSEIQ